MSSGGLVRNCPDTPTLIDNIKKQLDIFCPSSFEYAKKMSGGILVKLNETGLKHPDKIKDALMHTFGISNFSFAGNAGKVVCGSAWYQKTVEAISSCNGRYNPPSLQPNACIVTFKSFSKRIGSVICQRYMPKRGMAA